jgi:hypothetical protein
VLVGQAHDPGGVTTQVKFLLRAQHPAAQLTPDLPPLDSISAGEAASHWNERVKGTLGDVGSAANDVKELVPAGVYPTQSQPVGVWVPDDRSHSGHDNIVQILANRLDPVDGNGTHAELVRQLSRCS